MTSHDLALFLIGMVWGSALTVALSIAKDTTVRKRHARRRRKSDASTPRP